MYKKTYPLNNASIDPITLTWEQGYKNIQVMHKDKVLTSVAHPSQLKKGFKFYDETLKEIELRFSENPMTINVIVDGFHSQINPSHPKNDFKKVSRIFWITATFNIIILGLLIFNSLKNEAITTFMIGASAVSTLVYIASAIFSSKAKVWAFYGGTAFFSVIFAHFLTSGEMQALDFFGSLVLGYYIMMSIFLVLHIPLSLKVINHNKNSKSKIVELSNNLN
jgi:hypothetical protein